MVKIRARDSFGNQGVYSSSSIFTVDTHAPIISNITASQNTSADTFTFHYDVSEDIGNVNLAVAISSDGGNTWSVATSTIAGDFNSVSPGVSKTISWNAGTNFNGQEKTNMQIRFIANDQYNNSSNLASANFSLDTLAPRVTLVSATQPLGGTVVSVNYTLADQNNSLVEMDVSSDGGGTWVVASSTVTGNIGGDITPGSKNIIWNAKVDFSNQQISSMKVQVRGRDIFNNQSENTASTNFSLDTLNPVNLITADLQSQPLAGDSMALVGGSFVESNPSLNTFYVAINGGQYGDGVSGTNNTATPANQNTAVGAILKGNDYISKVKITHTDKYGQSTDNENISPSSSLKYVKPHTPGAPTVDNPTVGTVDVLINKNVNEADGLQYTIFETSQSKYVQANGTLGANPVWQPLGVLVGQWGEFLSTSGKVRVTGLSAHSYLYQFEVKSRNSSDSSHALSSESALSSGASSANQSPVITINSVGQITDGGKYVLVNYNGADLESETSTLVKYEYSTDNANWHTMTQKSGVGSSGTGSLVFANAGTAYVFAWDTAADLSNTEDDTVYVRLQANDGTSSGNVAASSAFVVDTKNPVLVNVVSNQILGLHNVGIGYDLIDLNNSNIELNISSDDGNTWSVATNTVSGSVGAGVTPGNNKSISWNALADFANQENSNMKVRLLAVDSFGNQSALVSSDSFIADTKVPTISSVSAAQNLGNNFVTINYVLSDLNTSTVVLEVSLDGGATWSVTSTSVSGDVGSDVVPGAGKIITWNAGTDFPNQQIATMKVRLYALDIYNNLGSNVESANFSLDTKTPLITNVSAAQIANSDNFNFTFDLFDSGNVVVALDISSDNGVTWSIATSSLSGAVGTGVSPDFGKTVNWNGGIDFNNHQNNTMKIRVRSTDVFNNTSINFESTVFNLDTLAPAVATIADLQSQPNAGENTALIGGSFSEVNPSSNIFTVAINGGAYAVSTTGQADTATPSNQPTAVGTILSGSDYISKVKIIEVDNFGHTSNNENISPNTNFKYVKPYTPEAPTVNNPQNSSVDLTINTHAEESNSVEYAILEVSTNKYVQANGTLATSTVWKTLGTAVNQWGNSSGVSGKILINGLTSPVANYSFKVKARNPSDTTHAVSSESIFSNVSNIINTAPTVNISSAGQVNNANYALINYVGTDGQNDTNNLTSFEFSANTVNWYTMTQKSGVGSSGINGLVFGSTGTAYIFAWDIVADLPDTEESIVYVRLQSSDALVNSNLAVSSAFAVDTLGPVISGFDISQNPGTKNIIINYNLSDISVSANNISLNISSDGGATWVVPTTTVSGDVGSGVSAGVGKSVVWNAGVDFNGHENSLMKVRLLAVDRFGNIGNLLSSSNFTLDTKSPIVSVVEAVQISNSSNVAIGYDLADLTSSGNFVDIEISSDGGATWTVASSTLSGDWGVGQSTGNKIVTWNAGVDFGGQLKTNMKIRVRARDYFANQGNFVESGNFSLDTKSPVISNVSVLQTTSTDNVVINYDLSENTSTSTVSMEISDDGGVTWSVPTTSLGGAVGNIASGNNKTVVWSAGVDLSNQEKINMRVRLVASDAFGNLNTGFSSNNFSLDTKFPSGLTAINKFSSATSSVTLNWPAVTDSNFDHYEIWHGNNQSDVDNRVNTALKWSVTNDAALDNALTVSTIITNVSTSADYFVKIFAIDNYGHESTIDSIKIFPEAVVITPTPVIITGGGGAVLSRVVNLNRPILNSIFSPTKQTEVLISGLADARTRVDLYDNNLFVARLISVTDVGGVFKQSFSFVEGAHSLAVRAEDFDGNVSSFSDTVNFVVITTAPSVPLVISPVNNSNITDATPIITGIAKPLTTVEASLDNKITISTPVDTSGNWQLVIPSTATLGNGRHSLILKSIDLAGNSSENTILNLVKISAPTGVTGEVPTTPSPRAPFVAQAIPPASLIRLNTEAAEVPGLPVPKIGSVVVPSVNLVGEITNLVSVVPANAAINDVISFSGTALPNQDVVVYIHSDQGLIYRTHTDNQGVWQVNHSQGDVELAPGDHTIFAVALDSSAKVKSRPSAVTIFTVKRNFWVMIFQFLSLKTTVVSLVVLAVVGLWLLYLKNKKVLIEI